MRRTLLLEYEESSSIAYTLSEGDEKEHFVVIETLLEFVPTHPILLEGLVIQPQ
jgi:hypothetical protein